MLFISDTQYYVPVMLCRMGGSIYLFKITGTLVPEHVKLKWNFIWDMTKIYWKGVKVTLNGNKVNLLNSVTITF